MSIKNKLYANELIRKFQLNVLINNEHIKNIEITNSSLSRGIFELTGEVVYDSLISITYFGNKEQLYLSKFDDKTIRSKISKVLQMNPPLIFLGPNFAFTNLFIELAKKVKIPIISVEHSLQILQITIGNWIQEKLAIYTMIHGCLVNVFGAGTLIIGKSGIGKSEVVIELIKKSHIFVADDSVLVTRIGQRLFGKSNNITKNFIEIRGLGILNIQKMFGIEKQIKSSRINIVCEMVDVNDYSKDCCQFERLGNKINYKEIEGVKIPYYRIPVSKGRNISDLIETAVTDLKLKKQGYFSANEFINQINSKKG